MLEFSLSDDGTMDTVVECHCTCCKRTWEERFCSDYAVDYRDPDGGEIVAFDDMMEDAAVYCPECED